MSRSMGLSSDLARAKTESFHSCQSMGWCAAERRYGLAESFSRFSVDWVMGILGQLLRPWPEPGVSHPRKLTEHCLLNRLLVGVAGIDGLAASESLILAMVEADAILAEPPAEINN